MKLMKNHFKLIAPMKIEIQLLDNCLLKLTFLIYHYGNVIFNFLGHFGYFSG